MIDREKPLLRFNKLRFLTNISDENTYRPRGFFIMEFFVSLSRIKFSANIT